MTAFRRRSLFGLWPAAYTLAVTVLVFAAFTSWAYDDPFITYRYAQNLASGQGLVYNPGQQVLSTTTPLFALLLALLSPLWNDLPRLANLIGAFGLALGGLCLWSLAQSWKQPLAGWAGLLLYPTFPLLVTTLGSEAALYLAFCLGSLAFYVRRRYVWAAGMAALAILARPDGALVALVLAGDYLLSVNRARRDNAESSRPLPWRAVVLFLALTVPWFAFAWAYYGSPLPVTLMVKQQQGAMAISQRFAPGLVTVAISYASHWQYWAEAGLALTGLAWAVWRARGWLLLLAWTALYTLAYAALGVTRYFWYYAPLVPGIISAAGLGMAAFARGIAALQAGLPASAGVASSDHRPMTLVNLPQAGMLAILVLLFAAQMGNLWQLQAHPDRRVQLYREIGQWLEANTPSAARIGALEVGILGYYARRPMLDFAGLVQPQVAAQLGPDATYEDAALWAVERYHPDYLVLQAGLYPRLEQGYVSNECRLLRVFPGGPVGYEYDMAVYDCQARSARQGSCPALIGLQ